MIRLSSRDLAVLQATILQANAPVTEIARRLKMQEHAVRRSLHTLIDRGVILARRPYLNPSVLGLEQYLLFFSLSGKDASVRKRFVNAIIEDDHVAYLAEVGGDYQYEVWFLGQDAVDLRQFVDSLTGRFGVKLQIQGIAIVTEEEYSGSGSSSGSQVSTPPLGWSAGRKQIEIDETDHRILSVLSNGSFESHVEIGRQLKIPGSTVAARIKRLEKSGLISGYCYVVDSQAYGGFPLILLVRGNTLSESKRKILSKFCRSHRQLVIWQQTIGPWEARIHARIERHDDVIGIVQKLQEDFPEDIQGIRTLPLLRFHKYTLYPFKNVLPSEWGKSR